MLIETITAGPVTIHLWGLPDEYVAEIYISGNLWDERKFRTEAAARNFIADPLRDDRASCIRERKVNAQREAEMAKISGGHYVQGIHWP